MKVLQIVGDSKYGGATYLILAWCQFLLNNKCDVTLLATDKMTVAQAQKLDGIKIIDSISIPRDIILFQDIRALSRLTQLIRTTGFDVVHTHTSTPGFVGRVAAWLSRTPVILHTAHGWPVTSTTPIGARYLFTAAEYLAGIMSSRVICVSNATAVQGEQLHIVPKRRIIRINNGIDPQLFINASNNRQHDSFRHLYNIPSDALVIGATGRLAEQKDVETLIRAISILEERSPNIPIRLLIAGDGPLRASLEALTQSLGLVSTVIFLGFHTEIPNLLAHLDIFVSVSLWEGLSISIMEAMASSLPIIATNIPPNAELIEDEVTGLQVPTKSPFAVAEAVMRYVNEPELKAFCSSSARRRLLEFHTLDRLLQETWGLYNQLFTRASQKSKNR